MTEPIPHDEHPYKMFEREHLSYAPLKDAQEWIDCFRAVFCRDPSGTNVLVFLAQAWHFFDRAIITEERRVQRQCFIDLLMCCGIWQEDVQAMRGLLDQTIEQPHVNRIRAWFRRLTEIRIKRTERAGPVKRTLRSIHQAPTRKGKL